MTKKPKSSGSNPIEVPPTTTIVHSEQLPIHQPAGEDPNRILSLVEYAVRDKRSMDEITRLTDLYMKLMEMQSQRQFIKAKSEFQKLCPPIYKRGKAVMEFESKNGDKKRKENAFPELSEICKVINPICNEVGLTYDWEPIQDEKGIEVTCVISHVGGYSKRVRLKALPDNTGGKNAIQAVGSTMSYLERYTVLAAFGIAAQGMDDDANGTAGAGTGASQGADLPVMTDGDFNRILPSVRKGIITIEQLEEKFTMAPSQREAFGKSLPQEAKA